MQDPDCPLCAGASVDADLFREEVWSDHLWRLTTARVSEVAGFSYLEPRRHIPSIVDLDGEEASTLGAVLARSSSAIREATGADLVYVYVFGDSVPHLHFHLAPHRDGGPLSNQMVKGSQHKTILPSGAEVWSSDRYPLQAADTIEAAITGIREQLGTGLPSESEGREDLA